MDDQQPATKADLSALKTELLAALHETETKLLRAFFQYQQQPEVKAADPQ